jgi:hypothetical protein
VTVDGAVQFEQVLRAGDERTVKPGRDVYMQVGNAGAVRWWINGQPGKDLGPPGQPINVPLTRATLAKYLR